MRSSIVTDLSENTWTWLVSDNASDGYTKYLEMVADQMSAFAVWTLNQDGSMMVSLLGQAMRRACLADVAGECKLI
jgi:hypothetical protein